MKIQTGIAIIALVFAGAFLVYSRLPEQIGTPVPEGTENELQANVTETLGNENAEAGSEDMENEDGVEEGASNVSVESTTGLSEELEGIIKGFNEITGELESLEGTSTLAQ